MFGIHQRGPYYMGWGTCSVLDFNRSFENTENRLNLSISLYRAVFGRLPDRIIFHTAQWDAQHLYQRKKPADPNYGEKILTRIHDLRAIVADDNVDIGLRTAAWSVKGGSIIRLYNDIVRKVAMDNNITMYDLDDDIWSSVNYNTSLERHLFRDATHPKPLYCGRAIEILLGRRYSAAVFFRHTHKTTKFYETRRLVDILSTKLKDSEVTFWRDANSNKTFFYNHKNGSRHQLLDLYPPYRNITCQLMLALCMSHHDILSFMDTSFYQETIEGDTVPMDMTAFVPEERVVINVTSISKLMLFSHPYWRSIRYANVIFGLGYSATDIKKLSNEQYFWLSLAYVVGEPVPDIFNTTTDWLLRFHDQRSVFLIRNGTSNTIDAKWMAAINKSFDDVRVVVDKSHLLPIKNKT